MKNDSQDNLLTLSDAEKEIARLRRLLKRRDHDNQVLSALGENAERLRRFNESEQKMQHLYKDLLLENCPNMLFLFDEEQRLVLCSLACLPLLSGTSRTALLKLPAAQVFSPQLDGVFVSKLISQLSEAVNNASSFNYDDTARFSDGRTFHVQVTVAPIVSDDGICHGSLININDINDLVETKRRAEEAAVSKSGFLANMSHDIRTPLNAIKGLSDLLALTPLDETQRSYLNNMISSTSTLITILNDVLDFAKIDARKIVLGNSAYRVAELLAEVSNVVSLRSQNRNLALLVEADPEMPRELWGDMARIKQVMVNLLSNAVKYTDIGYVKLRLFTEPYRDAVRLVCEVEDSGIGIYPDDVPTLFEAFTRVGNGNKKVPGTGLGLAISKQLVLAMNGDISVHSTYGKGSTFTFWVPQRVADPNPLALLDDPGEIKVLVHGNDLFIDFIANMLNDLNVCFTTNMKDRPFTHCIFDRTVDITSLRESTRQEGTRFALLHHLQDNLDTVDIQDAILFAPLLVTDMARFLRRKPNSTEAPPTDITAGFATEFMVSDARFLLVDENELDLLVASEMLRVFGARVECATSGQEAIRMCSEYKYDLIFMDHSMQEMDGIETTHLLRDVPGPNRKTPIIALTSNVDDQKQSFYLRNGLDDFTGKPIEFSELTRVLMRWLPNDKLELAVSASRMRQQENAYAVLHPLNPPGFVLALDTFGLYASAVLRELDGDYATYFNQLCTAGISLPPLFEELQTSYVAQDWDSFTGHIVELGNWLQDIGARDAAAHAHKLALAAQGGNTGYVLGDYASLMESLGMLQLKLEVLRPLLSNLKMDDAFNNSHYLMNRMEDLGALIANKNFPASLSLLNDIVGHSLNRDLDNGLRDVKSALVRHDVEAAAELHQKSLQKLFADLGE